MLKAILFDIDGTLIDSNDGHARAWEQVFAEAGTPLPYRAIRGQIGKGGDNLVPALLPGTSDAEAEALAEKQGEIYRSRYMPHVSAFPAVCALMRRLHSDGIRLVLASSAGGQEIEGALAILGCDEVFTAITGKDDAEGSKPAPDIFAAAMAKLPGIAAADVLVVGDTPYDVRAAKRCGLRTVAVTSGGFGNHPLESEGAVALYHDPADILANYDRFVET